MVEHLTVIQISHDGWPILAERMVAMYEAALQVARQAAVGEGDPVSERRRCCLFFCGPQFEPTSELFPIRVGGAEELAAFCPLSKPGEKSAGRTYMIAMGLAKEGIRYLDSDPAHHIERLVWLLDKVYHLPSQSWKEMADIWVVAPTQDFAGRLQQAAAGYGISIRTLHPEP